MNNSTFNSISSGSQSQSDSKEKKPNFIRTSVDLENPLKRSQFDNELSQKLSRLQQFIETLGQLKDTPIQPDAFEHFEIQQEIFANLNYESVILEAERRIDKMMKTHKIKRNWSICDLKILVWIISKHCQVQNIPVSQLHNYDQSWNLISSLIPGTTIDSCLFKWLSLKRYKITVHGWSSQEEKILSNLQKKYSQSRNKWKYISQNLYSLNPDTNKIYRHPKQCRQHYASFLDPTIKKGPWTKEEDVILLTNVIESQGQKKWCRLVKILEGRTENAIKNRFQLIHTKLKKRKDIKNKSDQELMIEYIKENGGNYQVIKKQRQQAAKKQEPQVQPTYITYFPQQPKERSKNSSNQSKIKPFVSSRPIIPNFNFIGMKQPSIKNSAFAPFSQNNYQFNYFQEKYLRLFPQKKIEQQEVVDEVKEEQDSQPINFVQKTKKTKNKQQ